ncbi:MAG TPA: hypothetical protein VI386_27200, partial [Candidatus Sulfotelmatobacter sp.]
MPVSGEPQRLEAAPILPQLRHDFKRPLKNTQFGTRRSLSAHFWSQTAVDVCGFVGFRNFRAHVSHALHRR